MQVEDASTGMTNTAKDMVRAASEQGVAARVNLMVMNFSASGPWSRAMLDAAAASTRTLEAMWPGSSPADVAARVGVTLMLGRNDTDATTTLADAQAVVAGAKAAGYGFVGEWSMLRDNGGCAGTDTEQDNCSGIDQETVGLHPRPAVLQLTWASADQGFGRPGGARTPPGSRPVSSPW